MGYLDDKVMLHDLWATIGGLFKLIWWIVALPPKIAGAIPWGFQKRRADDLVVYVGEPRHIIKMYGIEREEQPLRALAMEGAPKGQ